MFISDTWLRHQGRRCCRTGLLLEWCTCTCIGWDWHPIHTFQLHTWRGPALVAIVAKYNNRSNEKIDPVAVDNVEWFQPIGVCLGPITFWDSGYADNIPTSHMLLNGGRKQTILEANQEHVSHIMWTCDMSVLFLESKNRVQTYKCIQSLEMKRFRIIDYKAWNVRLRALPAWLAPSNALRQISTQSFRLLVGKHGKACKMRQMLWSEVCSKKLERKSAGASPLGNGQTL